MKLHIDAGTAGARTAIRKSARIDADTDAGVKAGRFMAISPCRSDLDGSGPGWSQSEPGDGVRLCATLVWKRRKPPERAGSEGDFRAGGLRLLFRPHGLALADVLFHRGVGVATDPARRYHPVLPRT